MLSTLSFYVVVKNLTIYIYIYIYIYVCVCVCVCTLKQLKSRDRGYKWPIFINGILTGLEIDISLFLV